MDQIDRENLQFILENTGPALEVWYNTLTESQKIYASRLLDTYKEELNLKAVLVRDPFITSLKEATQVINKFR